TLTLLIFDYFKAQRLYRFPWLSSGRWISGEAYIWCDTIFHHVEVSIPVELEFPLVGYFIFQNPCLHKSQT
ncbi:hypothetical protein, partial [Pseudomonas yangonensis]